MAAWVALHLLLEADWAAFVETATSFYPTPEPVYICCRLLMICCWKWVALVGTAASFYPTSDLLELRATERTWSVLCAPFLGASNPAHRWEHRLFLAKSQAALRSDQGSEPRCRRVRFRHGMRSRYPTLACSWKSAIQAIQNTEPEVSQSNHCHGY